MNQHFASPGKGKNGSLPETYGLLGQSMAGVLKEIEDRFVAEVNGNGITYLKY